MRPKDLGAAAGWVILGGGVALIVIGVLALPMLVDADLGRLQYLPVLLILSGVGAAWFGMRVLLGNAKLER